MLTEAQLEACHDFAARLAVDAGALLCQSAFSRALAGQSDDASLGVKDKASSVDIVTETDIRVEDFILKRIREQYPSFRILAEETYAAGGSKVFDLTDEPTWIVDPLDGTVNHVHLFPLVCVSIGLAVNKKPVVGAVYAPLLGGLDLSASRGCLWSACRHRGAYQSHPETARASNRPNVLSLSRLEALTKVPSDEPDETGPRPLRLPLAPNRALSPGRGLLLASEWGKDRRDSPESNLNRKANAFLNLASEVGGRSGQGQQIQGIRSLGSAALDLVYCASGAIDVFWEGGCWEWDVCAGLAILLESGGIYTDANAPPATAAIWSDDTDISLPQVSLGARRFLCIRSCPDRREPSNGEIIETAHHAQVKVAKSVWKALYRDGLDYKREGVQYPSW